MAKTMTVTVSDRLSLGGTDYLYVGSLKPDTEYETAGDTLTNPTTGWTLPEKIKWFSISGGGGGYEPQYVPSTGKVKIFTSAAAGGEAGKEAAAKADLSAQSFPFACIGC